MTETIEKIKKEVEKLKESGIANSVIYVPFDDMQIEHINRADIHFRANGAWQDFIAILLNNGYEVTCKVIEDEIAITWRDKNQGE